MERKPKLLLFGGPWDYVGKRIRESSLNVLLELLRLDFETICIEGDCDFAECVEKHHPDMIVMCSGVETPDEPVRNISNTDKYPEIPRLGYLWRDPITPTRLRGLMDLKKWGVHRIVTQFRPSDVSPVFKDAFFLPWWNNSGNGNFRDYGLEKIVPVFLYGAGWMGDPIYPWRSDMGPELMRNLPTMLAPAGGNSFKGDLMIGEECGRMLNRSWFSAACSTISHTTTKRMLEIPSCRCCLITEDIKITRGMGFVDGVNCIMPTKETVVGRVRELLDDKKLLMGIIDAGCNLVRERHGPSSRRIFKEYYDLCKTMRPGQRIVQTDAFKPLTLIGANDPMPEDPYDDCPLFDFIRDGYTLLDSGKVKEAVQLFLKANSFVPYNAESIVGMGICLLRLGEYEKARLVLIETLKFNQVMHSPVYDPVSEAFAGIASLAAGHRDEAVKLLATQPLARHPALDAARFLLRTAVPQYARYEPFVSCTVPAGAGNLLTLHPLPEMDFEGWVGYLTRLIRMA
jgi:hypothetical protein